MTHETLAIIWFGLWGLIWAVYFVLDGYGLGTGMLFPFIAKTEQEKSQLEEAVGPFWGGNEVWLITAGGVTFAAFPLVYAEMFSCLYTPLMMILFALFFRATGLEFRHKHHSEGWKSFWTWAFFTGSSLVALLFGVAFANLYQGLLIDAAGYQGTLFSLLNPYGLLGGVLFVVLFLLAGALWIGFKTSGPVQERALALAGKLWPVALAAVAIFYVASVNRTPLFANFVETPLLWLVPLLSLVFLVSVKPMMSAKKPGGAFGFFALALVSLLATGFIGMFPYMLPSKIDPAFGVTLFQAASSPLTLTIMLGVSLVFVPIVIAYQIWMYRIFRGKITPDNAQGY